MKKSPKYIVLIFILTALVASAAFAQGSSTAYTIEPFGVNQWKMDSNGNKQYYNSKTNWMISGKHGAYEDFYQTVESNETKTFLGNEFKKTDFSGKYIENRTANNTISNSTTKKTTETNILGIKGKETKWKTTYENKTVTKKDNSAPTKIDKAPETYHRDVIDGKVYDSKGRVVNEKQAKDFSVKSEPVSSENIVGKTGKYIKDNTKVKLYEKEFGKYNNGFIGYDKETGEPVGKFRALGVESGGKFRVDVTKDGAGVNAGYNLELVGAKYADSHEFKFNSQTELDVNYEVAAKAYLDSNVDARIGKDGAKIKGEVGAGAVVGVEGKTGLSLWDGVFKADVGGGLNYGAQAKANGECELSFKRIKLSAEAAATLGLGGKLSGGVEIDLELATDKLADKLSEPSRNYIEAISGIQNSYNLQMRGIKILAERGGSPEELEKRIEMFARFRKDMRDQLDNIIDEVPWWLPGKSIVLDEAESLRNGLLADDNEENLKQAQRELFDKWSKKVQAENKAGNTNQAGPKNSESGVALPNSSTPEGKAPGVALSSPSPETVNAQSPPEVKKVEQQKAPEVKKVERHSAPPVKKVKQHAPPPVLPW